MKGGKYDFNYVSCNFSEKYKTQAAALKKGDKVYVEGKLKTRKWKGDDGVQRYSTEVHVSEFNFLSNKNDVSNAAVNEPPMNPPSTNQDSMASSDNSDDLPF